MFSTRFTLRALALKQMWAGLFPGAHTSFTVRLSVVVSDKGISEVHCAC